MLECLIVGDTTAYELSLLNPKCLVVYKPQSTVEDFLSTYQKFPNAKNVIISIGSEDNQESLKLLPVLRAKFPTNVAWVLPSKNKVFQRKYVIDLAYKLKDNYVEFPNQQRISQVKSSNTLFIDNFTRQRQENISLKIENNVIWPMEEKNSNPSNQWVVNFKNSWSEEYWPPYEINVFNNSDSLSIFSKNLLKIY